MPFDSRSFRVLIASPSDVEEERELAVRVIQEWNDLYSYTRRIVLLPLRWETHASPEYGSRPQEVINRAIVDECDLLVGIFWTRIGTPTGVAESGTVEEIVRVASAGKPVMLYFSQVKAEPDRFILDQLSNVREFREKISRSSLVESYKSHIEFRDKFARQLEYKVRELHKADGRHQPPPLDLIVHASNDDGAPTKSPVIHVPVVEGLEELLAQEAEAVGNRIRDRISALSDAAGSALIQMAMQNNGTAGIRNLYTEVSAATESGSIEKFDGFDHGLMRPHSSLLYAGTEGRALARYLLAAPISIPAMASTFSKSKDCVFSFDWDALQPQRTRSMQSKLLVKTRTSSLVSIEARVYADSFPEPLVLKSEIQLEVREFSTTLSKLGIDMDSIREDKDDEERRYGNILPSLIRRT